MKKANWTKAQPVGNSDKLGMREKNKLSGKFVSSCPLWNFSCVTNLIIFSHIIYLNNNTIYFIW